MSHSPPVPPGNQSTYPLKEPPHAHPSATTQTDPAKTSKPDSQSEGLGLLPILATAGAIGLVAGAITLFLHSRGDEADRSHVSA